LAFSVQPLSRFFRARTQLLQPSIVWVVQEGTALFACAAFISLLLRAYKAARIAAMLQITSRETQNALDKAEFWLEPVRFQISLGDTASLGALFSMSDVGDSAPYRSQP
jgi:hypothetical protein